MEKRFKLSGCYLCDEQINESFNSYDPAWLSKFINGQCKVIKELEQENQQLQQSQNQKAIEVLKEVNNFIVNYVYSVTTERNHSLQGYIQSKIAELRSESK